MLAVAKNTVVTGAAKDQVEVRQLEIDWYCNNYSTINVQAAMLAGFAFAQITTPMPEEPAPPLMLEFGYLFLTCTALGLELGAIILSTFLSVWAPSLALRGKEGTMDLHKAVTVLHEYQNLIFLYFIVGWLLFFVSNICQVWIYFRRRVAVVVTFPLSLFVLAILYYTCTIMQGLRLDDNEAVVGKIDHFQPYELIGDLDHGLTRNSQEGVRRASTGAAAEAGRFEGRGIYQQEAGYCPVLEAREQEQYGLGYQRSGSKPSSYAGYQALPPPRQNELSGFRPALASDRASRSLSPRGGLDIRSMQRVDQVSRFG